ncbi:MAG: site-specific integrase [Planctomycetaceae bacterium]
MLRFLAQRESNAAEQNAWLTASTDRVIVETLLFSGLRNSEFCQLTLASLSLGRESATLNVQETPRQNRVVRIPRRLGEVLHRYCQEVRRHLIPDGISSSDRSQPLVFNERGKAYERTALYRRVVRILTDAGLGDRASVQLLRHTYGYLAFKQTGGNLLFLQKQLGHAHPMVTAVYAEFVDFPLDRLADQIAEPFSAVRPEKSLRRKKS